MDSPQIPTWLAVYGNIEQPGPHPSADIFGIMQFGYFEPSNASGQFKILKWRPGVKGTFTDDITYYALFEFANNPITAQTTGGGRLLDLSMTFSFRPVRLQIGQTVLPFAADETPASVVPWVDYSDVVKNVYLRNRITDQYTNGGRELGAMAWQEFTLNSNIKWLYFLGLFNGTGLEQLDTNDAKDFMAHTKFKYGPFNLGASYWTGTSKISGENVKKDKYNIHLYYGSFIPAHTKDKVWALIEYMATKEEQPAGGDLEGDGWQAAAGFRPTKETMITYRYSEYNYKPTTGTKNEITMHSFIAQYFLPKIPNLRFMAQYDIRDNKLNPKDKSAIWFQISVPFSYRVFSGLSK
ncbi:MAG: hypothetical protein QXH95_03305 [Thermoplasmata archaeon]